MLFLIQSHRRINEQHRQRLTETFALILAERNRQRRKRKQQHGCRGALFPVATMLNACQHIGDGHAATKLRSSTRRRIGDGCAEMRLAAIAACGAARADADSMISLAL